MKVDLIDYMGDDITVVNSARVSFNKESDWQIVGGNGEDGTWELALQDSDERLINYLARHGHFTPFTHPQITLRETVPIFVARQRFKHVVGFTYNEVSRRYVDDEPEFYEPDVWRSRPDGSVKQGSGEKEIGRLWWSSAENYYHIDERVREIYSEIMLAYKDMIVGGVAPEQARMILPQSMYTSYYVTGSLAAFARMYKQRIDAHAQKEIQDLAKKVGEVIEPLFPASWKALTEG